MTQLASTPSLQGVCAIGASAGGLEPLETFFGSMPVDTGLAFVVIQHLSPDHGSMMDSLLGRHTRMPVRQAEEGDQLQANHVYLIPPDCVLTVEGKTLRLEDRDHSPSKSPSPHPIDTFFRSLAHEWGPNAAAIVLSGTGNDGAAGTEDVRRGGGLTLAQDESASFEGMPRAAFDRGFVDVIASVPAITTYVSDFFAVGKRPSTESVDSTYSAVEETIISDLATSTGINFGDYKKGTVRRRLRHRMNALGVSSLRQLADIIGRDVDEREELTHDILIGVTAFFRDDEVFHELPSVIDELLMTANSEDRDARIWVAGCATGQEAYSLAILCFEACDRLSIDRNVQIFATDVHEVALARATEGYYSDAELDNVDDTRRRRFFQRQDDGWRVRDELRASVTFARQNMLTDTPFSRIDLVSCRNALIYFTPTAQQRALWSIGFSLRSGGILLLGTSESPGFLSPDFDVLSSSNRIFRKLGDGAIKSFRRRMGPDLLGTASARHGIPRNPIGPDQALLRAYDLILDNHFVSGLILDSRNEVLHVIGQAKHWLEYPTGRPKLDVHALLRTPTLRLVVGAILRELSEADAGVVQHLVSLDDPDGAESEPQPLLIQGEQIRSGGSTFTFISGRPVERPVEIPPHVVPTSIDPQDLDRISQLESDLLYTRESLQAALEEQETSNEELNAANEELIASNEELQSSNEELSALNEELRTLNDEHHRRLEEVFELTADLEQILTSTEIGILLLNEDHTIRRFSDPARDYFHLMASDQGRPFDHIRARFDSTEFDRVVQEAPALGSAITMRATMGQSDQEVLVSVRPYGLPHGGTGVAITVVDLGTAATSRRESLLATYVDTSPLEMTVFDETRRCILHSDGGATNFVGSSLAEIADDQGMKLTEIEALFDRVDEMSGPYAGVIRMANQRRAVFVWKFTSRTDLCYGVLAANMDDLQATLANWVESQTVGVIADLTGVGAAVVHPDGTFGERFSAHADTEGEEPPLDLRDNMQALSDIVASSAELGFEQIDQTVDMFVHGSARRVHVRGVRLGSSEQNPYLTIIFDDREI